MDKTGNAPSTNGAPTNIDFRLSVGFFEHPKIQKLRRRLGKAGVLDLIVLLRHTAQNKPDGILGGMDTEDIAIAAGHDGDPDAFVATLIELRLLDEQEDGVLAVHDWEDHNPYAAGARRRSEAGRKGADARWGAAKDAANKGATLVRGTQDAIALPSHQPRNAPSIPSIPIHPSNPSVVAPAGDVPFSDPLEGPADDELPELRAKPTGAVAVEPAAKPATRRQRMPRPKPAAYTDAFERWWARYPKKVDKIDAAHLFAALLEEGITEATLHAGLDGWLMSDQWTSDGGKYVRSPERWLADRCYDEHPTPARPPTASSARGPNVVDHPAVQKPQAPLSDEEKRAKFMAVKGPLSQEEKRAKFMEI